MTHESSDLFSDQASPSDIGHKIIDSSLKAAGYSYLVGDAALFAAGIASKRYKEASSGLLYGIGGLACAKYGDPNMEQQLEVLSHRLRDYLKKEKIDIPKNPTTALLTKESGIIERIEDFLHTYPSHVLNGLFALGGVQLTRSGIQKQKHFSTAAGIAVTAGALGGLLIEEKKPDPENPPHTLWAKAKQWVQEKPLRWSGSMYMVNNVALTMDALAERKQNPLEKTYLFKFLTVASYLFANSLLNMSSKAHADIGELKEGAKAMQRLAEITAHVIAAQHPEVQETLVRNIAGYLSTQPGIGLSAAQITNLLHTNLTSIKSSMPATGTWEERTQSKPQSISPSL